MNFNFATNPEYNLNTSLIEEAINLYGILVKFLVVDKINRDDVVFGDYSHLETIPGQIYDMYMLPEISEDWDTSETSFSNFGLTNFENINLFVAKSSIDLLNLNIDPYENVPITGNLLVLPNNKVMEITNSSWEVPGINNLFTHNNSKSVLKLSCKPHDFKLINEVDGMDISAEEGVYYETLDNYFGELISDSSAQDNEASVTASVTTIQKTGDIDNKVSKPIIDKTEDDVWGQF